MHSSLRLVTIITTEIFFRKLFLCRILEMKNTNRRGEGKVERSRVMRNCRNSSKSCVVKIAVCVEDNKREFLDSLTVSIS